MEDINRYQKLARAWPQQGSPAPPVNAMASHPTSPPPPPPSKSLPPVPAPSVSPLLESSRRYPSDRNEKPNGAVVGYTIAMVPQDEYNTSSPVSSTSEGHVYAGYRASAEPSTPVRLVTPQIISTPPPSYVKAEPLHQSPSQVRRKPLDERNSNTYPHTRIPSFNAPSIQENDIPVENHQPLQYHHMLADTESVGLNSRASKLTIGTTGSEGSSGSEPLRVDHLLPNARSTYLGNGIQRPNSVFSTSDARGRSTDSPSLRPIDHARTPSRHSRSPDNRLSYVDLLNVPYPQPAPNGAEKLINTGLRNVVGENASLLSTRKTLDMYRANVKKTNDPAIQYEFAVFMISAAQEEGLEIESSEDGGNQPPAIRTDLLKEAKHILQKLCDRSYPFAQYYLADGYASGLFNNGRPDLDRSFPLFLAASKHGHAEAMYRTALCYEWGWGCRIDAAKAVQFYQHAASKNHPGAMLRLGRACLTGDMGLGKRYREGIRWLKRGAESADFQYNQAPYDLACLHETGYGADVFKDESYAAQLYTKAADLGHKDASFRLGEGYEYGQLNCPKDAALSIHFYTGAAEQGHPQAQMALCAWYMVGVENVLEKDESEAYEWAKKAAEQGLAKAQYTIGYFTEMGIGCRRDPLEANVWYVRAADQGEERAKHRIAAIRAAATGADPVTAAKRAKGAAASGSVAGHENEKKKRFGIF